MDQQRPQRSSTAGLSKVGVMAPGSTSAENNKTHNAVFNSNKRSVIPPIKSDAKTSRSKDSTHDDQPEKTIAMSSEHGHLRIPRTLPKLETTPTADPSHKLSAKNTTDEDNRKKKKKKKKQKTDKDGNKEDKVVIQDEQPQQSQVGIDQHKQMTKF